MLSIASCSIDYKKQNLQRFKYVFMNVKEKLGERICELRREKSLSQEKLALKANIDRAYMHLIEKGKTNVSIELIEKIAIALEINIKDLF